MARYCGRASNGCQGAWFAFEHHWKFDVISIPPEAGHFLGPGQLTPPLPVTVTPSEP